MADDRMKVLALSGSLRQASLNSTLLRALPELAPGTLDFEFADPVDLPIYNDDSRIAGDIPPLVTKLKAQIDAADGLVIASPEYNHTIGAPLKNVIDWLSKLENQPFRNKPVAILSAATGLLGGARGQYHLRQSLNALEARVMSKPEVFVSFAAKKITDGEVADETTRDMLSAQMKAFAAFLAERAR